MMKTLKKYHKIVLYITLLLLTVARIEAQCTYPGGTAVGSYTFCIDNSNTITTAAVTAGQYVTLNVIQGFNYTFSVGDITASVNENLTLYNGSTNTLVTGAFATGATSASITWTATFSGQVKIVYSSGSCSNTGTSSGTMTLVLNSVGNTVDSQTSYGTNQWVGHVYNFTGGPPPGGSTSPTTPSTTTSPYTAANYVGYYNVTTETISESFGGNTNCFAVTSQGSALTNIYTELFAVRYRMRSTRAAGCYMLNVNGDDGVRVYVDNVLVFDQWKQQGNTYYCNNLIYLNGNSDIILDYYEYSGGNVVGLSLTSFSSSTNAITSSSTISVCSGVSPGTITANSLPTCSGGSGTTYQWQVSTDNVTFTDISGATGQNYVPSTVTTAGTDIKYYRRNIVSSLSSSYPCDLASTSVKVTTSGTNSVSTASSSPTVCISSVMTNITHTTTGATGIGTPSGLPSGVTASFSSNTITISGTPTASGTFSYSIPLAGGCGSTLYATGTITVYAAITSNTVSAAQSICINDTPSALTGSSPSGGNSTYTYLWESSTTSASTGFSTATGTNNTLNYTPGSLSVSTWYRRVVASGGCSNTSTAIKITVNPAIATNTVSAAQTICTGLTPSTLTATTPTGGDGSYSYIWQSSTTSATTGFTSASGTNNTSTYSPGTLTATTWYRRIVNSGGCSNTSTAIQITVSPNNTVTLTSATSTTSQSVCTNTAITAITYSTTGAIGASFSGLPTGVTGNWTSNAVTISGTPTISGSYSYTVSLTGGCGTNTTSGTIQVSAPTAPIIGTITAPTCTTPTTTVTLTGLPSTGTWTLYRTGTSIANNTGTGATYDVTGLTAGTYTFTVSNGTCTSAISSPVTTTAVPTVYYNGSSWDATPTLNKYGVITTSGTLSADTNLCSCTVNSGATITVSTGIALKIQNQLTVNGSLIFENEASLIQINDSSINTGSIIYKRYTTSITNFDYTYWSSPVVGQKLSILSPDTFYDKYYSLNAAANAWTLENRDNLMTVGKGYIIRGPEYYKAPAIPGLFEGVFTGVPNNGVIKATIGGAGTSNLLGNPYASAIDADTFIAKNSTIIEGTLYFWTHNTAIQLASNITNGSAGSGVLAYTSDDYASYNATGGTATAARSTSGSSAGVIPTGKIAAGQGFIAIGKSTTDAEFNNSMRLNGTSGATLANTQFFKTTSSTKTTSKTTSDVIEKNRLWLNLTNTQGAFKQILIGYVTGATNDYESAYDGVSFNANAYVNFYSINNKFPFSIQGRATATQEDDSVPLGYSSTIEGEFKIAIDTTDGTISNQNVYLEDKLTSTTQNLTENDYSFTTATGTFEDRFVITYKTKNTETVEDLDSSSNLIYVTQKDATITIHSPSELINEVSMYDISGKLYTYKTMLHSQEVSLAKIPNSVQMLVLKIKLENGQVVHKKIVQQYN